MNTTSLLNLSVRIVVSDPWEFGTECGTGPFAGVVSNATSEVLVIRLLKPIAYRGKTLQTAVARPRHAGDTSQTVTIKVMPANLILLPLDIRSASGVRPSVARDGFAVIGTVECTG